MRSIISKVLVSGGSLACASALATACVSRDGAGEKTGATGSLSMPLSTVSGGTTYRLANVDIFISGPTFVNLTESNPAESVLSTTLPTGNYSAFLESWTLEKDDGSGNFLPVLATLESSASSAFSVFNGTTTTLVYRFLTDGVIVTVGSGQVDVVAAVDQVPPLCTPLGADCPPGSWCPPAGLAGADLACVAAGAVPVGQPCFGPLDCVANASCFDQGAGPVCAALCAKSAVGAPCDTGGTCLAAGIDYGVCSGAAADGGTDAGADADAGADGGSVAACVGSPPLSPTILGASLSPGGGTYTYANPGLMPPVVTTEASVDCGSAVLHVMAAPGVPTDPANASSGFGIFFVFPTCVDASAFTGVSFTIAGNLGTCSLTFSTNMSQDSSVSSGPLGACTAASCVSPQSAPLTTGSVTIPFTSLTNAGTPVSVENPSSLVGVNWNLLAPTDGESAPCAANFTIGDVSFVGP